MSIAEMTRSPAPCSLVWPFSGKSATGVPAGSDADLDVLHRSGSSFASITPLEYFASQCSATAESGAPAFFRRPEYRRLMLPFWSDGHINLILVGFETGHGG